MTNHKAAKAASEVTETDGTLTCSCGAVCRKPKDRKRFKARHPVLCSERRDFAHQLAQGTRCVETTGTDEIRNYLKLVTEHGRGLTPWETEFVASLTEQFNERAWITDKQREILDRIYKDRT